MRLVIAACAALSVAGCSLLVSTTDLSGGAPERAGVPDGGASDGDGSTGGGPEDAGLVERDIDGGASDGDASTTSDACAGPTTLLLTGERFDIDVGAELRSPACAVQVTVVIAPGATVGATSLSVPALWVHGLAAGSTVSIQNAGRIIGAGGKGGSGGNGGSGGSPQPCGRPGAKGGTAILLDQSAQIVNTGSIFGGGGGGGGASGGNAVAGGGGGAGVVPGLGGAPATTLGSAAEIAYCGQDNGVRSGTAGAPGIAEAAGGRTLAPGDPSCYAGRGGEFGSRGEASSCYGTSPGGAAGFAIKLHGAATTNIASGSYATGAGPIRGEVGVGP